MNGLAALARRYRVSDGAHFRLADVDPADTAGLTDRAAAEAELARSVGELSRLQETLYADGRWAVLCIFQAMDAAGKDGTIKHVMSGVNPQGCQVHSFRAPTADDLAHDFLRRAALRLPERGRIGIFNRSYYEEVLVARVHPELLAPQQLPPRLVTDQLWNERYESIAAFERHLVRNGTVVLKFMLHLSRAEQARRLMRRMEEPDRQWKFSTADLTARARWDDYMTAYEKAIRHTATDTAPWFVVPADHKWFTRLVVSAALIDALERCDLRIPTLPAAERERLDAARDALRAEMAPGRPTRGAPGA